MVPKGSSELHFSIVWHWNETFSHLAMLMMIGIVPSNPVS